MLSLLKKLLFGVEVFPPVVVPPPVYAPVSAPIAPNPVPVPILLPTVAIVNVSSVVTDQQLANVVAALQIQVNRDFGPVWKTGANLIAIPKNATIPAGAWVIYVMDDTDQAGALGYHDLTPDGLPVGKIFAKDDLKYGLSWSVTLSHELCEILADPWIQNTVFSQETATTGTLFALEVADPVESDEFAYMINGVMVSDFVYPAWFESWRALNSTQFDHMNVLHAPLVLARGGYIGIFTVPTTLGWIQRFADQAPPARLTIKGNYSRTQRRAGLRTRA